jgi:2-polyprenyl-3-methyl-5-hydroxy-6-metoxy-1,4-benzoquinol methylase
MACVLCGGERAAPLVTGIDRMLARPGSYSYARCAGCGLVSQAPLPEESALAGFYSDDYYRQIEGPRRNLEKPINRIAIRHLYGVHGEPRSTFLRSLLRPFRGRILNGIREPRGESRLLDVGCGAGAVLEVYRRLGWTVAGIDSSADAAERCRNRGLTIHRGTVFDAPFGADFDVVLMSHVIEHVLDPVATLRRVRAFLAPGGVVAVATPNIQSAGFAWYRARWFPLDAPRHLHLFDERTLALAAEGAGLSIDRIETRSSAESLRMSRRYALAEKTGPRDGTARDFFAAEPRDRWFRTLVSPLAGAAALAGRGEILEADLGLTS